MHILDPVILFFIIGGVAQLVKSDLRIPEDFYNTISIYLLLAIGIKGGLELYKSNIDLIFYPMIATIIIGPVITFIAYFVLRVLLTFDHINSTAIAAHYGSCSAVTFAVVADFLRNAGIYYEQFSTVLLVIFEIPAIAAAIFIARIKSASVFSFKRLLHDVFFGKSILLLSGGLFIGYVIGYSGNKQLDFFFLDLFKGFLALFMLEMGIVAAKKLNDLRRAGVKLIFFWYYHAANRTIHWYYSRYIVRIIRRRNDNTCNACCKRFIYCSSCSCADSFACSKSYSLYYACHRSYTSI